jgi:hypothetical protein
MYRPRTGVAATGVFSQKVVTVRWRKGDDVETSGLDFGGEDAMVGGWWEGVQGFWIYDLRADGAGKSKPGFFDNRKTGK